MDAKGWIELLLAALLVVNLVVLGGAVAVLMRRIGDLSERLNGFIEKSQTETLELSKKVQTSLGRIETLTTSLDELIRTELAPTLQVTRSALENVDTVTRGVRDSVQAIRGIVSGAQSLTTPAAIAQAAGKMMQTPGGRAGLIAVGIGAAVRALFSRKPKS